MKGMKTFSTNVHHSESIDDTTMTQTPKQKKCNKLLSQRLLQVSSCFNPYYISAYPLFKEPHDMSMTIYKGDINIS